jgi:hypothetical protein
VPIPPHPPITPPIVTAPPTVRTIARGTTGMPWVVTAPALQTMTVWHGGEGKPSGKAQPLNTERLGQQESHFLPPADSTGEQGRNAERTVPDLQMSEASSAPLSETETGDLPPPVPRAPSPPVELTAALLPPQAPKADALGEQPSTWSNLFRWASVTIGATAAVFLLFTGRNWVWQRYRGRRAPGNDEERRLLYTGRYRVWQWYRGRQATGNDEERRSPLRQNSKRR